MEQQNARTRIAIEYARLPRGPTILTLTTSFSQKKFIDNNREFAQGLANDLSKSLLKDHHIEAASEGGLCSAAVMHWLSTGTVPKPTEQMVTILSKVQGSAMLDNEPDYLPWISNLSSQFKGLQKVKDSHVLDFNVVQAWDVPTTLIEYLLDGNGVINKNYKIFLILIFQKDAHAVGLNFGTNEFFDPNYGVWKVQKTGDDARDIASLIIGLNEIRRVKYAAENVQTIRAITYL